LSMLAGDSDSQLQELGLRAEQIPQHIGIIMEGNGRWAEAQGYPRCEGHRKGVSSVRDLFTNLILMEESKDRQYARSLSDFD